MQPTQTPFLSVAPDDPHRRALRRRGKTRTPMCPSQNISERCESGGVFVHHTLPLTASKCQMNKNSFRDMAGRFYSPRRMARHPLAIGEHEPVSRPVPYRSDLALTGSIIVGGPNQSELCTVLSENPRFRVSDTAANLVKHPALPLPGAHFFCPPRRSPVTNVCP